MSDDIFADIWKKLSDIYARLGTLVVASTAGGTNGGTSKIGGLMARLAQFGGNTSTKLFSFFSKLPGLAASLAGVATVAIGAFAALAKVVHATVRAQLESLRQYSKLNAAMSRSFAMSDVADIFRDMKFAGATSRSTDQLNSAFTGLKDALLGLRVVWTNTFNKFLTVVTKAITIPLKAASDLATGAYRVLSQSNQNNKDLHAYLMTDQKKTFQEFQKEQREREKREDQLEGNRLQLPMELMFRNILNRNWGAVVDTRKPLF